MEKWGEKMKYTRYDLKKDTKKRPFVFMVAFILAGAFLIGTAASELFLNNYGKNQSTNVSSVVKSVSKGKSDRTAVDGSEVKFTAVQGGMYKNSGNAYKERDSLSSCGTPFIVKEDGKIRVFLGIYGSDALKNVETLLKSKSIDSSNMNFSIKKSDLSNTEIIEILNANLQILNKFSDINVKYIKTLDLKKWCSSLKETDKTDKNFKVLSDLKKHTAGLEEKLSRDKSQENYIYIYGELKQLK